MGAPEIVRTTLHPGVPVKWPAMLWTDTCNWQACAHHWPGATCVAELASVDADAQLKSHQKMSPLAKIECTGRSHD